MSSFIGSGGEELITTGTFKYGSGAGGFSTPATAYTPSSQLANQRQSAYLFAKATGALSSQLFPSFGPAGLSPGRGTAFLSPDQLAQLQAMQAAGQPVGALLPAESPFLPLQAGGVSLGDIAAAGGVPYFGNGFASLEEEGAPMESSPAAKLDVLKWGAIAVGVLVVFALARGVRRSR